VTADRDDTAADGSSPADDGRDAGPRPLIERVGLAAIALLATSLFATIGIAAATSGELFLGAMGAIGALMTVWAALSSLRRG
jgi:hypothetical protein